MIDVKEAIAVLKQFKEESQKHKDSYTPIGSNLSPVLKIMQDTYQENIDAFEMAIKSLERTRWIPVSERLPETRNGKTAVVWQDGEITLCHSRDVASFLRMTQSSKEDYITHWMPLPEPPQEVE